MEFKDIKKGGSNSVYSSHQGKTATDLIQIKTVKLGGWITLS